MKRTLLLLFPLLFLNLIYSQSVDVKDSGDQLLLQVNDEGDGKSSITIPSSGTAPTSPTSKLYNEGGTLKWSGNTLNTGTCNLPILTISDAYYYDDEIQSEFIRVTDNLGTFWLPRAQDAPGKMLYFFVIGGTPTYIYCRGNDNVIENDDGSFWNSTYVNKGIYISDGIDTWHALHLW